MRPWLALAALCVALPALSEESKAAPVSTTEVSGSVVAVDFRTHRLTVDTAGGAAELGWDRNTLIYQPGGATTAGALRPGAVLKAGLDPARTAYWIQVRPPPPAAPTSPGSGSPAAPPAATPTAAPTPPPTRTTPSPPGR